MEPVLAEIAGWEGLLVLLIILLLFGGAKLPGLARSMGEAAREFRKGVAGHDDDPDTDTEADDNNKKT
jgi:sec-independent protein translocase protein TatA